MVVGRLGLRIQESPDELAILRALEDGLSQAGLTSFVGRLEQDGRTLRLFQPTTGSALAGLLRGELPSREVGVEAAPLLARVLRTRESLFIDGAGLADILPAVELGQAAPEGRVIVVPMVAHDRVTGALIVVGRQLEPAERAHFRQLADQLAVAFETVGLIRDLKQALLGEHTVARELRRLEALVAELADETELEAVLRRIVAATADAISAQRVGLYLVEPDRQALVLAAEQGLGSLVGPSLRGLALGEPGGPLVRTVADGQPVVVEDTRREPGWAPLRAASDQAGLRSCWAVPLVSRQGERLGAIVVYGTQPGRPTPSELELAQRYAHHAALAISSSRRQEQETRLARDQALFELARTIPHELGQPLAIISGYAELIAEGRLEGERLREACRDLVDASAKLAELVQRLEHISSYASKDFGGRTVLDLERSSE